MYERGGGVARRERTGGGVGVWRDVGWERGDRKRQTDRQKDRQGQSQRQRLIEKKGWREVHRCKLSANVTLWRQTHTHTHTTL